MRSRPGQFARGLEPGGYRTTLARRRFARALRYTDVRGVLAAETCAAALRVAGSTCVEIRNFRIVFLFSRVGISMSARRGSSAAVA